MLMVLHSILKRGGNKIPMVKYKLVLMMACSHLLAKTPPEAVEAGPGGKKLHFEA